MGRRYERITRPLLRDGDGFREATWDEALDRVAERFGSAIATHGPTSFGMFSCSKTTNEMNFMAQKFARVVMGSNNIDSCNRT
jgi:formate dehydrogenase major subunit